MTVCFSKCRNKKHRNMGNKGIINHIAFCAKTISVRFKEPTHKSTVIMINPIETSYETICAAERNPPKKAYFELLAHPDIIIPYTPKEDTANRYKIP